MTPAPLKGCPVCGAPSRLDVYPEMARPDVTFRVSCDRPGPTWEGVPLAELRQIPSHEWSPCVVLTERSYDAAVTAWNAIDPEKTKREWLEYWATDQLPSNQP
jgi:hypothetical protein